MASGGRRRKPRPGFRPKAKKKTKYLSLSRIIKAEAETPPPREGKDNDGPATSPSPPLEDAEVSKEEEEDGGGRQQQQQQAEPFALHHEASTLFAALPAPSLSDILGAAAAGGDKSPSPSASPGGTGLPGADEEEDLARRALRGRERWVYCCSSPTTTATTTTATSSSSPCSSAASTGASARSLLLKLDYEEILAAWAGRGSLYMGHAAPKPEPDPELENVLVEVETAQHAPETAGSGRAESVRRYKEKRRNRLFVKRIRYEVRRVNAVKRPRFKGRFIKEQE